jgi:4-amino-4-deoxy-L-arabinose transferase-like glycosyltransferase
VLGCFIFFIYFVLCISSGFFFCGIYVAYFFFLPRWGWDRDLHVLLLLLLLLSFVRAGVCVVKGIRMYMISG